MKKFFDSREWRKEIAGLDYAYWDGANKRLDELIARIGHGLFAKQLDNLREHLDQVDKGCTASKPCMWGDNGCGYPCMDMYCVDQGLFLTAVNDPAWKRSDMVNPTFFQKTRGEKSG